MSANFKNTFNEYLFVLVFMLCIILNVIAAFFPVCFFISAAIFIASTFFFDINKNLGILFIFIFTEAIPYLTIPAPYSFIILAFIIFLSFIIPLAKMFIKKEIAFNLKNTFPLIFCGAILLLTILNSLPNFEFVSLRFTALLVLFYAVFMLRKKFDILEIFRYFYTALITTCLFSLVFWIVNPSDICCYHDDGAGYLRFKGLTGHENSLYVYALTLILIGMLFYFKKKIGFGEFLTIAAICAILGLSTCSKTFLIMFPITCAIFFFFSFKYKPRRFVEYEFILFALLFLLAFLLIQAKIFTMFDRFFLYFKEGNIINMLTTGRYDIYERFVNMWVATPWTVLFGIGANYNLTDWVHCFYLEWLAKFGIVGFGIVVAFFTSLALNVEKIKLSLVRFAPLAVMLVMLSTDDYINLKIIAIILCLLCIISPFSKSEDYDNSLQYRKPQSNKILAKNIEKNQRN